MASVVDELIIEIKAETKQLKKQLNEVNKSLNKTEKSAGVAAFGIKGLFGAAAIAGIVSVGRKVVNTSREFEDLAATLTAVTQSTEASKASFDLIEKFTATTTFQLQDVTEGFIKMYQTGIIPTSDVLGDFGNVAAANNKSFTQLADTVFKAATGEFDAMKQFGITMRKDGDSISAIFEGQTTTFDNTREAITKYIRSLGKVRFAGAIEARAKTLTGAVSNLGDALATTANTIGEAGLNTALGEMAIKMKGGLAEGSTLAEFLGGTLAVAVNAIVLVFETLESILNGIVDAFKKVKEWGAKAWEFLPDWFKDSAEKQFADPNIDPYGLKALYGKLKPKTTDKGDKPETIEEADANLKKVLKTTETVAEGAGVANEAIADLKNVVIEGSAAFTTDFVDALLEGENALDSFKNFARDIVSQIIAIFLQMEVVNRILANIFPNMGISYGGIISDAGGGKPPETAGGGAARRGVPTIVGERGMELFVPHTAGTILNNMNTKNALGGGAPVIVNQSVNFSTGVVPTVRAEVQKMLPQISDVTKGAVLEAAMRGGSYRRGLQGG